MRIEVDVFYQVTHHTQGITHKSGSSVYAVGERWVATDIMQLTVFSMDDRTILLIRDLPSSNKSRGQS
jgi:hypothetical protein